jgi:DNA recombination protein RmuC
MEVSIVGLVVVFLFGLFLGWLIRWLLSRWRYSEAVSRLQESAAQELTATKQDLATTRATSIEQMEALRRDIIRIQEEKSTFGYELAEKVAQVSGLQQDLATATANLRSANEVLNGRMGELTIVRGELSQIQQQLIKSEQGLALAKADNRTLEARLQTQLEEVNALQKRFATEFENMANKILDSNSQKFTALNKSNLEAVLDPLGKQINEFKEQVNKVYQDESKERFSLGAKVKELSDLNQQLAKEARNLSTALRNESKTQGRWGEVILETILERSGLRKGETYFMEYQLFGPDGQPLRSEARGTKMRPDAIVKYPDNRHVIIDSKVSLTAFVRSTEAEDPALRQAELTLHLQSMRGHIVELQSRAYDDYDKTLDFVMMFVPMEAAYVAAVEFDPDIWQFAYDRRVLLINPTNLIVCLKLIVDLWKREYQNQNSQAIADRGSKLYDKFVGFVNKLQGVGSALDTARSYYDEAYKQLSTGRDNLVLQATKLKALGVKTKSDLPESLVADANSGDNAPLEEEQKIE